MPAEKDPSSILIEGLTPEYHRAAKVIAAINGEGLGAYATRRFIEAVRSDAQQILDEGVDSLFKDVLES